MLKKFISGLLFFVFSFLIFASPKTSVIESDIFDQDLPVYVGREKLNKRLESVRKEREPLVLVLAGGSARAYAHIGVLRVLEQNNIKPDVIVANSMGAIIGMLYSAGFSPDDIEYLITNLDINSFFDLVFPLRGGALNQRYFRDVLMRLFPGKRFNLEDCIIPVVIPCEDLISKRIIYFSSGDFGTIMTAAFSMVFTMEPVDYVIDDGENKYRVKLTDAGTVDIGQLSIAMELSDNVLLSTAFYTPEVNLNNIIVVLNRTFAIGKERVTVRQIHENNIPYIRNEVENFSFMDFSQIDKIIRVGEKSTEDFLKNNPAPLSGGFDFTDSEFTAIREMRKQSVQKTLMSLDYGDRPVSNEFYAGVKIRPNIPFMDAPLFDLNENFSAGVYGFADFGKVYLRGGAFAGGKNFGCDVTLKRNNDAGFGFLTMGQVFMDYEKNPAWYAGQEISFKQYFFPGFYIKPFVTAELSSYDLFCKTGFDAAYNGKSFQIRAVPYGYYFQNVRNFGAGDEKFSDSLGFGGNAKINITAFPLFGFSYSDTLKVQKNSKGVSLVQKDSWRGNLQNVNENVNGFINLMQGEMFFYKTDMSISFMESFLLEKTKAGAYCDIVLTEKSDKGIPVATGAFAEAQFAFMGLYKMNFMGYAGWDFSTMEPSFGFSLKESW